MATKVTGQIIPFYLDQIGGGIFELGVLISLFSSVILIARIPLSILSEKLGRWSIIPPMALGVTTSLFLYSFAQDTSWFYPIRIMEAISISALTPTALTITQTLAPPNKRGEFTGKILSFLGIAGMVGPYLASFLTALIGYSNSLRATALFPLASLAIFLMIRSRETVFANPNNRRSLLKLLKTTIFSRGILVLFYLRFFFSFGYGLFLTTFSLYALNVIQIPSSIIVLFFGVLGTADVLSRFPVGKVADSKGYKIPTITAYIGISLVYFFLSEVTDISLFFLLFFLFGIFKGLKVVTEVCLVGTSSVQEVTNIAMAYIATVPQVGQIIGALTAGILSVFVSTPIILKVGSILTATNVAVALLLKVK